MKVAGQHIPHESALGHVTGDALYTDDIALRLPGVLHAWPVMAPHAHALLTRLNEEPALAEPGVVTTLTAADVPGEGDSGSNRHDEPLFPVETVHHSQAVAWVLGESLEAARRGAARVEAEYRALPAILTIEDAIAAGSFHAGPFRIVRGDAAGELAASPGRIEGELFIGGQEHFYLETQASLARLDEDGVFVESSTQHPSETQEIVARVLGIARSRVTVECRRMGGAFGGKEVQANPWAAIAALGAWKTKRPVRVRLPRKLDMALTGKRHPFLARFAAGFEHDGRLRAVRLVLYSDGGWSLDLSSPVLWRALFHCDNAYLIPHLDASGWIAKTHKTSQTAFRGFGGPQGMIVIEDILDRIARALGIAPHVVRERNFYREGDVTHYGQQVKDAARIERIWDRLKETSSFDARRGEIAHFNGAHRHVKRGIAITPVKFGISFTATFFNQAGALVLMYRDGSVQVNHGGTEMGQGLQTKILQIAADSLGVPPENIRVMATRTDKVPNTSATAASAGADLNGAAVVDACRQIMDRLRPVAAELLKCADAEVRFEDGFARGPEGGVPIAKIAEAAYRRRIALFAHGYYRTPEIWFDVETARGKPFHYFAYGAAVSEVEIDGFTGIHRILRADLLEDVGDSVSPLIDLGQIEGGFVQGAGWLTIEELLWDEQGRLATGGASTYKLPSWSEMPPVFNVSFLERAAEPGVVFGSKAVGEPPLMLAISVREAIRDAIAAFGGGGVVTFDSPATPERIFRAIQEVRKRQPAAELTPDAHNGPSGLCAVRPAGAARE
jgi:xanthine dehydrogenase large subunit